MRTLRVAKLGHAGTLDPFAEGLMVVGIGRKFTRSLQSLLTGSCKEYVATIELGSASDTFDPIGAITDSDVDTHPSLNTIRATIDEHLLGERTQIPPSIQQRSSLTSVSATSHTKKAPMPLQLPAQKRFPFSIMTSSHTTTHCSSFACRPLRVITSARSEIHSVNCSMSVPIVRN